MAKYKCPDPKCSNKDKTMEPGFCPECGKKLRKSTNLLPIALVGGVLVLLLLGGLIYAAMTMPLNASTETTNEPVVSNQSNTATPAVAGNVFENQYVKFQYPTGWTVTDNPKNGKMHVDIKSPNSQNAALFAYPKVDWESNHPNIKATLQNVATTGQSEGGYQGALNKITVAGTEGWEYVPLSENNMGLAYYNLYFAKGTTFYVLSFPTADYNADAEGINLIVSTMEFK